VGVLEIHDLRLELNGKQILDGLDVDFWEGHVHAVVGPNGAGKSTLAATIMGLYGYGGAQGEILLDGTSIMGLDVAGRAKLGITLAWQEPARYEGLTVGGFIRAGAKDKSDAVVRGCLEKVGLDPDAYARRAVDKTLSGGERKKVELASIIAMEPRVAILDELDSGIDVESLVNIFSAVQALKAEGATVVLITHSLEVLKQADHAFLLCNGKVVDKGPIVRIRQYFEGRCMPCDHKNLLLMDGLREVR
jgi:Fe-S cluster assembly ATP-binding protein